MLATDIHAQTLVAKEQHLAARLNPFDLMYLEVNPDVFKPTKPATRVRGRSID